MKTLTQLVRKNILELKPYSSARDEFSGTASVYLDANENPFISAFNRYPDPQQREVKMMLAKIKNVEPNQLFLGNGSDEAIDLLIRIFCEPGKDAILITEPTYGMYAVCAGVNNVAVQRVTLDENFELNASEVLANITTSTKLIFLCSPNNPSGNLLKKDQVAAILQQFDGIVVIDEAYIDFADDEGWLPKLNSFPNMVVLQTFSKAWGLAGLRLGMCFAAKEIIDLMNKVKYPYNINTFTQHQAMLAILNKDQTNEWIKEITEERMRVDKKLRTLDFVTTIYPSDANFLLVKMDNASDVYNKLLQKGIIVRDRSRIVQCANCLRITVGTKEENDVLLTVLQNL